MTLGNYIRHAVSVSLMLINTIAVFAVTQPEGAVGIQNLKFHFFDDEITVKANFVLDSLHLRSNRMIVMTPVIEDGNGNVALFRPLMLTGRNQHFVILRQNGNPNYPDAIEVRRMNGEAQTVTYRQTLPLEDWMLKKDATLRVNIDTCGCGDLLGRSIGNPVAINKIRIIKCPFAIPIVDVSPERFISGAAFVTYELDSITLKPALFTNPEELAKISNDIDKVAQDSLLTVTGISIHGFASPEGTYEHNTYLARERARTLLEWVRNECEKKQVNVTSFKYDFTPENWEGLIDSLMNHPELKHRDEILALARNNSIKPDDRDNAIRSRYPVQYDYILKNWYNYLRHADYKIGFRLGTVSIGEIRNLVKTNPQVLSLKQFLLAAKSYEAGSEDFNYVFDVAVRMYPDDELVNTNAACAALISGDTRLAAIYLEKAGNSPEAVNARGVVAMIDGRYDDARSYFTSALNAGLALAADNIELLNENDTKYLNNLTITF